MVHLYIIRQIKVGQQRLTKKLKGDILMPVKGDTKVEYIVNIPYSDVVNMRREINKAQGSTGEKFTKYLTLALGLFPNVSIPAALFSLQYDYFGSRAAAELEAAEDFYTELAEDMGSCLNSGKRPEATIKQTFVYWEINSHGVKESGWLAKGTPQRDRMYCR
jgi:hypothetical protein